MHSSTSAKRIMVTVCEVAGEGGKLTRDAGYDIADGEVHNFAPVPQLTVPGIKLSESAAGGRQ